MGHMAVITRSNQIHVQTVSGMIDSKAHLKKEKMKSKTKIFLLMFVKSPIFLSCSQWIDISNKKDTTSIVERVPRYEDFVIDSNNRIDYFFKRFNVKKESEVVEKRKSSEIRTTAKGKYKNLDFTVTVYSSEGIVPVSI